MLPLPCPRITASAAGEVRDCGVGQGQHASRVGQGGGQGVRCVNYSSQCAFNQVDVVRAPGPTIYLFSVDSYTLLTRTRAAHLFNTRIHTIAEPPPKGLPTPFAIVVSGTARSITLCATSPELASAWATYLSGVADASVQKQLADYAAAQAALAAPAAAAGAGDAAAASSAAYVDPVQPLAGWLEVSSPDAKYSPTPFMKLYARLDPSSRLLLFFNSAGMEPGTEKAVVDLLSAVLYNEYPQLASPSAVPVPVPPQPSAPAFWLQVEDEGIFGPGPGRAPATTLVAESAEACATWIAAIAAACDPSTMKQASEEEKAAAPVLSTALLHSQRGAGIFNALGSTLERKVIVHPASKTLTLYTDARGVKPAVVLRLAAEHGVRFDFRCDEKGPANKAFGCLKVRVAIFSMLAVASWQCVLLLLTVASGAGVSVLSSTPASASLAVGSCAGLSAFIVLLHRVPRHPSYNVCVYGPTCINSPLLLPPPTRPTECLNQHQPSISIALALFTLYTADGDLCASPWQRGCHPDPHLQDAQPRRLLRLGRCARGAVKRRRVCASEDVHTRGIAAAKIYSDDWVDSAPDSCEAAAGSRAPEQGSLLRPWRHPGSGPPDAWAFLLRSSHRIVTSSEFLLLSATLYTIIPVRLCCRLNLTIIRPV